MQFLNTLIRKIMRRYLEFSNSLTTFVRVMKQRVEEIDFLRDRLPTVCVDSADDNLPHRIYRRHLWCRQTVRLYVPHASLPARIRLSVQHREECKGISACDALDFHPLSRDGDRICSYGVASAHSRTYRQPHGGRAA